MCIRDRPLSKSFFQISHVEHEQPFYQLSNLPVFKMRCQLYEYTGENINTGVDELDNLDAKYAYKYILSLNNTRDSAQLTATLNSGALSAISIADSGNGYYAIPGVVVVDSSGNGAAVTVTIDSNSGEINGASITNPGSGYVNPTFVFASPSPTLFKVGETITSVSGTTVMRGEVAKYSDSDDKIHIIHAGADDGKYHTFATGKKVVGLTTGAGGVITLVVEDNQLSNNEQNDDFSTGADFIDFSESNPFGDVSNN